LDFTLSENIFEAAKLAKIENKGKGNQIQTTKRNESNRPFF
jgi:hypothetical protein